MPLGSEVWLAQGFAGFFRDKIETIHESFNLTDGLKVPFTYPNHLPRMSSFKAVSLGETRWLLSKANPTTCLLDTIPTKLLKAYLEVFLPLITRLLNLSLTSGIFLSIWKRAIVKLLLKQPEWDRIFKNYRPVSNLNFILKLLKKCCPQTNPRSSVQPKVVASIPE